jgi:CHRD domain-containing protein
VRRLSSIVAIVIAALVFSAVAFAVPRESKNFGAHLRGGAEVPPVDTKARGNSIFGLSKSGDALRFKLIVANIEGVTQAHIHCGAAGVNGPVVVFLFGPDPAGVTVNGVLAKGTITNADVIPAPDSSACPGGLANFDELIAKMRAGDAYVNVHTIANPGGEIRGQIRERGPS